MKIFFTSDLHFGHANIMKHCNRPFKTVEKMDLELINRWNNKVSNEDSIYILGDFGFYKPEQLMKILNKLNGQKFLIKGNHDHFIKDKTIASKFAWIKDYYRLKYNGLKFVLFHYPICEWDCKFHNSIHLYGHVHNCNSSISMANSYNVGVDVNNYEPIEINEILEKLKHSDTNGLQVHKSS